MNKWKFITAGLVLVIIILCMMTFYLNGKHHNLEIQVNRMDREHEDLRKDYEKLYTAYYSYDKKVLKILEASNNVTWAEDSSSYIVVNKDLLVFGFYKKPRMQKEHHIWMENKEGASTELGTVENLKPHEFIFIVLKGGEKRIFVAPCVEIMPDSVHSYAIGSEMIVFDL